MSTIDTAVADALRRLKACGASIKVISETTGIPVGTVWGLLSAEGHENLGVTLRTLRRLENGLVVLESRRGGPDGVGETGHAA